MGYMLENFGRASEQKIMREAMTQAGVVLKEAKTELTRMRKNSNYVCDGYVEWFGARTDANVKYLYEAILTMEYAVNSTTVKLRRTFGNVAIAEALPPGSGWANKSVKQIVEANQFAMRLYDGFFVAYTEDRGGKFGPIKTFVHEMSHIVAETNEPIGTYPEVYGKTLCRILANNNAVHAVHNADTWGYFCISFLEAQELLGAVGQMFG